MLKLNVTGKDGSPIEASECEAAVIVQVPPHGKGLARVSVYKGSAEPRKLFGAAVCSMATVLRILSGGDHKRLKAMRDSCIKALDAAIAGVPDMADINNESSRPDDIVHWNE